MPLLASVWFLACAPLAAGELDLQSVLDNAAITPPSRVAFREIRHNRLLKQDLEIEGYIEYMEEGLLRKVIEAPYSESFLIREDSIEIDREGEIETLSLKRNRALKTMLGGVRAILSGQGDELTSVFDLELSGTEDNWTLRLRPRSRHMAKQLSCLTETGDHEALAPIRLDLDEGEWHSLEILRTDPVQ
jgi:hypothetical protein